MTADDEEMARRLACELEALVALDPRLGAIAAAAGPLPLRRTPGGLGGLIGTIVGQQVSRASAQAILGRFASLVAIDDLASVLAADETVFRQAGLSRAKEKTILGIAAAAQSGALDLDRTAVLPPDEAIAELVRLPGIGPWTAECFLLFSVGHADIFPAGDLALQVAARGALDLPERPTEKALARMALAWSPHRSVAARLLWAHYRTLTRRDAVPDMAAAAVLKDEPRAREKAAFSTGFTKATR